MDQLLKRLDELEKRIIYLESKEKIQDNIYSDFKNTINTVEITDENLTNIFKTSILSEIIKIIINKNKQMPFLQYKKHVYKFENDNMVKMDDADYKYMFEYIEYLILKLFKSYSLTLKSEDYYEKSNIIYGLKFDKNIKKIKSLFLESL